MTQPLLSICIPTVEERIILLNDLTDCLKFQIIASGIDPDNVELLISSDDKQQTIGAKREKLKREAVGKFIAYIDDDDWTSHDYLFSIVNTLIKNPNIDCIGFLQSMTVDGGEQKIGCISNEYTDWDEQVDGYDYVRPPFCRAVIRRELALQVPYRNLRYGEDYQYSLDLVKSGLLKKQVFIDKVLYHYRYSTAEEHNKKYGINPHKPDFEPLP